MENVVITLAVFKNLIDRSDHIVSYNPLPDEPDISTYLKDQPNVLTISQAKNTDPFAESRRISSQLATKENVILLVPGTKFDVTGNRRGRGGGWYDRFLSTIPDQWIIIGMCFPHQLSPNLLIPHPWDMPVQKLLVVE